MNITESFDEIFPITRIESTYPWILDEWEFEVNNVKHVVRFTLLDKKKRTCQILFGIRKNKNVSRKITSIGGKMKKYLATVLRAIEQSLSDPTMKLKSKIRGIVINMPDTVFALYGERLARIFRRKFIKYYKIHASYNVSPLDDEKTKAFYMYSIIKKFEDLFEIPLPDAEIPVSTVLPLTKIDSPDELQDEVPQETSTAAEIQQKSISKAVSASAFIETAINKGENIRTKYTTEEVDKSWLETYIYVKLFHSVSSDMEKTNVILPEFTISDMEKIQIFDKTPKYNEYLYLVALNYKGIQTKSIYDYFNSPRHWTTSDSYERRFYNIASKAKIEIKNITRKSSVSWEEVVSICENAESFFTNTLELEIQKSFLYTGKNLISSQMFYLASKFSIDELKQLQNNIYKTHSDKIDVTKLPFILNEDERFKFPDDDYYTTTEEDIISYLADNILDKLKIQYIATKDEKYIEKYIEYLRAAPLFAHKFNLFSEDPKIFKYNLLSNWTTSGGTNAQLIADVAVSDLRVNNSLNSFYVKETSDYNRQETDFNTRVAKKQKEVLTKQFDQIYAESQEFFKQKYKKKYGGLKLKLYRGVGITNLDTYVPGALESWSLDKSTATRFAKMMGHNKGSSILEAEVPIEHIWGSYESLRDSFPPESNLKGKKEHIVMGGTFATTQIKATIHGRYSVKEKLFTVKEYFEMLKEQKKEYKILKIVTPSMKGFKNLISKAAFGNDMKENQMKEKDQKDDRD